MHIKNNKNKGKSSEQRYCLFLYNSEVFLNVPAIRHFVGFTLHSIVKNTSSFEKKEKCNCTPLQKCCKHFGCIRLFFSSCWFFFSQEKRFSNLGENENEKSWHDENCNVIQIQAMRCKKRTRWAMKIIFSSSDTTRIMFLQCGHVKQGGGGKGCAYLLSIWTSPRSFCFFIRFSCLGAFQS